MNFESPSPPKRRYRQGARADAARAAAERILDVFVERLRDGWFEEIRLDEVARAAGVSVQTVIRRYGGKEGLLEAAQERLGREVRGRRGTPPGNVAAVVRAIVDDYEAAGDLVLRALAQEDRYPAIRRTTDVGRAGHRAGLAQAFAAHLKDLPPEASRRRLDALVVATDVYVWKLVRRDMGRPTAELVALMETLVRAALEAPHMAGEHR